MGYQSILTDESVFKITGLFSIGIGDDIVSNLVLVLRFDDEMHVGKVRQSICTQIWCHLGICFLLFLFKISRWNDNLDIVAAFGVFFCKINLAVIV